MGITVTDILTLEISGIRSEKDEISIRFHDTKSNDVVWYAFTRFKRPSDQYNQVGVDSLIQEVLSTFN